MRVRAPEGRSSRPKRTLWSALVVGLVLGGAVQPAQAILSTPTCLGKKLSAWGTLRKCQATADGKELRGNPTQAASCRTRFEATFAALNARAKAAGIPCRYQVNGDGTATDFDTGLQWEQKTVDGSVHDWG